MNCRICKLNLPNLENNQEEICYTCKGLDIYICKSVAKKEYKLNDNDLDELYSFSVQSKKYRKKQTITLYIKSEVEDKSNEKYNGKLEQILERKQQKKELNKEKNKAKQEKLKVIRRKEIIDIFNEFNSEYIENGLLDLYMEYGYKIPKTKYKYYSDINIKSKSDLPIAIRNIINIKLRKIEITNKLQNRGLELRHDSKICHAYINGGMDEVNEISNKFNNVDDIIDAMEEMKFFYDKTNYSHILSNNLRNNHNKDYYDRLHHNLIVDISKEEALYELIKNPEKNSLIPTCLTKLKNKIIDKQANKKVITIKKNK
jgi:hypothetical protein